MRSLLIPISLGSLAYTVICRPSESSFDNYDVFSLDPVPESLPNLEDPNAVADTNPFVEQDFAVDMDPSPLLISSSFTNLDDSEAPYLSNDAMVDTDPIDGAFGASSPPSFQLAEGTLCPGKNRGLWCCPVTGTWVGCIPYNGEPWGICTRSNQHCCYLNLETKEPYDCEKLYPTVLENIEDFLRGIQGPGGGGLAPEGGGFLPLPDLS